MRRTRILYRIHRWTGLCSALFVVFFSITGALAVYRAEIDRWTSPGLAIPPRDAPVTGMLQPALDAARAVAPERAAELMWLPPRPDEAIVVRLAPGGDQFRVFVDPLTARVTGTVVGEHAANVIRQVHLRFYFFGWQGRVVAGLFGLVLLLSAVTGAFIYAPFMRGVWQSGRRWWQVRDPALLARAGASTAPWSGRWPNRGSMSDAVAARSDRGRRRGRHAGHDGEPGWFSDAAAAVCDRVR